ncbi:hypothetical protein HYT23_06845 [Candidatus Pacearchaeota archaeon]|nr:hypothetical protein [Candidatus Pacearchaeota archaeon]
MVKFFKEFISSGIVKKVKKDLNRAKNLAIEAKRKISSLKEKLEKIGVKDENANDNVEHCYDIIMFLVRSKILLRGFNASGFGAHEAEISYMRYLGFNEKDVQFVDKMRYFRNGILYYGTRLDKEYAEKVILFTKENYIKLKNIVEK